MSFPVKLQCYDVSQGMARQLSPMLLGRQLDGIWHTAILVYDNEYFFGGDGISFCPPGGTILGPPHEVFDLGDTEIGKEMFHDYLEGLAQNAFRGDKYHLLNNNCNAFSAEVAMFLTSRDIPLKITNLTADLMNTSFGQMIRPFIDAMHGPVRAGVDSFHFGHGAPESTGGTTPPGAGQQTPAKQGAGGQSPSKSAKNASSQSQQASPAAPNPPQTTPNASKATPSKSTSTPNQQDQLDLD